MSFPTVLARAISAVANPLVWALVFLAAAYQKKLFHTNIQALAAAAIGLLPPLIVYFLLLARGKLTDPDISRRKERYVILLVVNLCAIILLIYLKFSGLLDLFKLLLTVYIIVAASSIITLFYKISFHMTFTYTFVVLLNYLYDLKIFSLLYLMVPLIFWARVHLKRHTVGEVVSALILDSLILYTIPLKPIL